MRPVDASLTLSGKSMKQQRHFEKDFSYGGFAIFSEKDADGDPKKMPAFIQVQGSEIGLVRIAKVAGREQYLHSECVEYDFSKQRDINRLKKKGVIGFTYDTPTETKLIY